jgi:type VI secretion system secreted protein Hcp
MMRSMSGLRALVLAGVVAGLAGSVTAASSNAAQTDAAAKVKGQHAAQLVLGGGQAIPVSAYSWSVTAESSWTGGGGASVGKPNPGAIRFTRQIDASTFADLRKVITGTAFPSAVFTVKFRADGGVATIVYELDGVFVTEVTQGAAVDGPVSEDLSVVFKKVTWTHTDASGAVTTGTWDVVTGHSS